MEWNDIIKGCVEGGDGGVAKLECIPAVLKLLIHSALFFAGIVAVFIIVHSGLKFILSSADPKKVENARNTMVYAIVGLIIILSSFFIINLISYITQVNCIKFIAFNCI